MRNSYLENPRWKWGMETSSTPLFCFFKKLYMRWKQLICSLVSIYTDSPQLSYNKNELYKTFDYWSRDMLNFDFLEKGLGINSPPHLVFDFSRKMFLILSSVDWPNFNVWLPLLLEILGNMSVPIACFPGGDIINFELVSFWSRCFTTWQKIQDKNLNISRTKRAFKVK